MNKIYTISIVLALAGCAHESQITPSTGHIDSQTDGQQSAKPSDNSAASIPKPVKNTAFLPPPKPKAKEQTYSVVVNEVPVKEILFALARDSKLNIDIHPSIEGRVTMNAVDQTLSAILDRISKQVSMIYKIENNVITITPDIPVLKTYQINYVNLDRDTTGDISVSQQIASSSSGGAAAASSGSSDNTSKTKVVSTSKNHFWDTLIANIKDILLESDKEILISRFATDATLRDTYNVNTSSTAQGTGSASTISPGGLSNKNSGNQTVNGNVGSGGANGSGNEALDAAALTKRDAQREDSSKEYRQLYAAQIIANKENGILIVRATQRQQEKVQEFIDKIQASAKRQVLIEASIVEITLNDQYQAGVDFSRLANGGGLGGITFQQNLIGKTTSLAASPFFAIGFNKSTAIGDLAASIRLLQTFGDTKVLSSPKLMVLNSQTAILKAVDNLVYFTVESTTSQAQTTSVQSFTTTPHTVPVGVWLSVTPQINENGIVTLDVRPTISRQLGRGIPDPNPSLTIESLIPQITVREMESVLQVPSGNTVILGGLMQDTISNVSNSVPAISKIPFFGNVFKAKNDNSTKTELVIFLRPTVIPNASLESDELQSYKQFLPSQQLQQKLDESAN